MDCNLKLAMGVRANCEFERCVFWRHLDDTPGSKRYVCILDHLNLIGPQPDRLTPWLLHYKLNHQRKRMRASLFRRHTDYLRTG